MQNINFILKTKGSTFSKIFTYMYICTCIWKFVFKIHKFIEFWHYDWPFSFLQKPFFLEKQFFLSLFKLFILNFFWHLLLLKFAKTFNFIISFFSYIYKMIFYLDLLYFIKFHIYIKSETKFIMCVIIVTNHYIWWFNWQEKENF